MRGRKYDLWKVIVAVVGVVLLLVLIILIPVSVVMADVGNSGSAKLAMATVQPTPTEDATVIALNKEKLAQEVQQLKDQNTPDFFGWLRMNAAILLSTLVVVVGGLIGLFRWFGDRRDTHNKDLRAQAEERFRAAVTALGDANEGTQVGGAILLRSFLNPDDEKIYARYYTQIFDLAVAYLRLTNAPKLAGDTDETSPSSEGGNTPLLFTPLRKALIVVFKEAFPLARKQHRILLMPDPDIPLSPMTRLKELTASSIMKVFPFERKELQRHRLTLALSQALDASGIVLDNAYLEWADLREVWMPQVSLRKANLSMANLYNANLQGADLSDAELTIADLRLIGLDGANLSRANLGSANLSTSGLSEAKLCGANLSGADLTDADLHKADLRGADLTKTKLDVGSMNDTILFGVKGLTKEQLATCKAMGAIINEDTTTSPPQSTVSPPAPSAQVVAPPPSQSDSVQAPSVPMNTSSPGTDGSSTTSSQQDTKP